MDDAAVLQLAGAAPYAELPRLAGVLAQAAAVVQMRLLAANDNRIQKQADEDELWTVEEAAAYAKLDNAKVIYRWAGRRDARTWVAHPPGTRKLRIRPAEFKRWFGGRAA